MYVDVALDLDERHRHTYASIFVNTVREVKVLYQPVRLWDAQYTNKTIYTSLVFVLSAKLSIISTSIYTCNASSSRKEEGKIRQS